GQPQVVYVQSPVQSPQPGFNPNISPIQQGVPQTQYFDPKGFPQATAQQVPHPQQHSGPGVRTYQNATPLASLGRSPAPVDCPTCGNRAMTRITHIVGGYTHAWAAGLCLLTGFFCFLPYLMDGFKNIDHNCGSCGVLLATWHKNGGVEVHQHA
ncbi:Lipopolysaccharide-induced tumor necrosis factor-alpha factor-like protein, partial [Lachnellula suecica]